MKTEPKIYAAIAALALGGGGSYLRWLGNQKQIAAQAIARPSEALPEIAVSRSDAEKLTKIELTRPDDDDKSQLGLITLEKLGPGWEMTSPLRTEASGSKVEAVIENLQNLHLWRVVDDSTAYYDQYDLTEAKALHIVAWKGPRKVVDLYCGKGSTQGQLARVAGKDGMFALVNWGPQGYAGFLFTRDLRSWRETSIFEFREDDVVAVQISNRNGAFSFSRTGGSWTGSFTRRKENGTLGRPERDWKGFDGNRVGDLLRAYRSLSADDFGADEDKPDSGVDQAEKTGGVVHIVLKDGGGVLTLRVGKLSKRNARWSIKDSRWAVKDGGDGTLYALSPWTAGWATAGRRAFEKTGGKKPDAPADRRAAGGRPASARLADHLRYWASPMFCDLIAVATKPAIAVAPLRLVCVLSVPRA